MKEKQNWKEYKAIVDNEKITYLYHFTDRDNLDSIIQNGGLYSWADCNAKGIVMSKPGGSEISRSLDCKAKLQNYVRTSFVKNHPMMYVAMNEGRISNPVILKIDPKVIWSEGTKYSDRNAARNEVNIGNGLDDFKKIHFGAVKARKQFDVLEEEQPYFQAEVLVKNFIPLDCIMNIGNFGIPIPSQPKQIQAKIPYTAQITRKKPTAFIFMVDHSVSMQKKTSLFGEEMTMAEAAARIVNRQINDLVLRCIKMEEIRHYYDIAVIGYGHEAYSGWNGALAGRDFVSPEELDRNPYKTIVAREEKKVRGKTIVKDVEKVQWMEARHDGNWTHVHKAFDRAQRLMKEWMSKHQEQDCYPPTIINITDGEFNGATEEYVLQQANELKSMFTNDGNVILFNIHFTSSKSANEVACPIEITELGGNHYAEQLFNMSSLLPERYNENIGKFLHDERSGRHRAMGVNADATTLIKLMDIGTPTTLPIDNVYVL